MSLKVLMIGLRSDAVDFEKWPELTKEKLEGSFVKVQEAMDAKGYDAAWCLVDRGETALEVVSGKLRERENDVVMIGAGVRADPEHLLLFEKLINAVVSASPGSKIAFNTLPFDTVEAVERWV